LKIVEEMDDRIHEFISSNWGIKNKEYE
jgi:hypothetical protein